MILPHELRPVDAEVSAGHGAMDQSRLARDPYRVSKSESSVVTSAAVLAEEATDVLVILNVARMAFTMKSLSDFQR